MRNRFGLAFVCGIVVVLGGCSINVKKEPNGAEKQVDINTLAGGIHLSNQAEASDVGIAVYPGARLKDKDSDGSSKSANVNLSGFGFGLKVVALEYSSDDSPDKVLAFYRNELKKYGNILECRTADLNLNMNMNGKSGSRELTCEGSTGRNVELKAGYSDNQHIVAVKPDGKGSSFSLVYVRTHGKDADI